MKTKSPLPLPLGAPPHARQGTCVQIMDVTPEIAAAWLKHNVKNRKLREDTVNAYARDMMAGNWLVTHQGVAFNDRNELIDGQHRLAAIVRCKGKVKLMVTFSLADPQAKSVTVMDTVDQGAARSKGDVLGLNHGIAKGGTVVAICNVISSLCYQGRLRKCSIPQALGVLELFDAHIHYAMTERPGMKQLAGANVMGAAAFTHRVNAKQTEDFYTRLNTGENLASNSPILHLRNFLMSHDARVISIGGVANQCALAKLVLQSFLLFVQGKPCAQLEQSNDGADYFRAKQKDVVEKIRAMFALPQYTPPAVAKPGRPAKADKTLTTAERNTKIFNALPGPAAHSTGSGQVQTPAPSRKQRAVNVPPPSAKELEYQKMRQTISVPRDPEVETYS